MGWFKKEKNVKIIDTGTNLSEPSVEQELRFLSERDRFINFEIKEQSKKTKNIIYGCQAVNALVKPEYRRPTQDYDIFSKQPRKHAIELEKKIDDHVGANIAQVKQVNYEREGTKGNMYRVELKNFDNIADYNPMPKNISFVTKNGVRYMSLKEAEKKYVKMIEGGYVERYPKATQDLDRIYLNMYWRKVF